jgi:outer membrane protein
MYTETAMYIRSKILITTAATLAAMMFAAAASAQPKIGTVRAQDLVQQSPQYQAAEARMKADFERRATELQSEGRQLQEDLRKFQQEADLMAPADRVQREKDLNTRQIDFGYKQRQFQEDVQNRERELFVELMTRIRDTIEKVARDQGLDLVLQDPIYASPGIDITDEILKRLQAER